jgi:hypothetical protein
MFALANSTLAMDALILKKLTVFVIISKLQKSSKVKV